MSFNFLKNKVPKEGLERAVELGFISKKESLELEIERAEQELKDLEKKKKK